MRILGTIFVVLILIGLFVYPAWATHEDSIFSKNDKTAAAPNSGSSPVVAQPAKDSAGNIIVRNGVMCNGTWRTDNSCDGTPAVVANNPPANNPGSTKITCGAVFTDTQAQCDELNKQLAARNQPNPAPGSPAPASGPGSAGSATRPLTGGTSGGSGSSATAPPASGGSQPAAATASGEDTRLIPLGPNQMQAQPRDARFNCDGGTMPAFKVTDASFEGHSNQTSNCAVTFTHIPAGWAIETDGSFVSLNNGPRRNSLVTVINGPLDNFRVYCEDCKVIAGPLAVANKEACHMVYLADKTNSGIALRNREFDMKACG